MMSQITNNLFDFNLNESKKHENLKIESYMENKSDLKMNISEIFNNKNSLEILTEELNKLQYEVISTERKVRELQVSKYLKFSKVLLF